MSAYGSGTGWGVTYGAPRLGTAGLRPSRAAADAPAPGRVLQLPDGGRAVVIAQDTAADSWHAQRVDGPHAGELVTVTGTRPNRAGVRPFPVVGSHLDADAYPHPTLSGLELDDAAHAAA